MRAIAYYLRKTRLLFPLLLLVCLPVAAQEAADTSAAEESSSPQYRSWLTGPGPQEPHWTLEIKVSEFEPELEEWETFYGEDRADQISFAVARKFLRWAEVGAEIGYIDDEGVGQLPINDTLGGEVTFNMFPLHLYVLGRGIFFEDQWVIPYVGAGMTRAYYRQAIENQGSVRGKADGDHVRAGVQILLDWLDEGSAAGFEEESVENSYLVIEALSFSAEVDGIELGGDSMQVGLVFEF
ncbi:MAG TPA: hypothetical protein VGL10_08515 [Gammaproteobacteria bacterium]